MMGLGLVLLLLRCTLPTRVSDVELILAIYTTNTWPKQPLHNYRDSAQQQSEKCTLIHCLMVQCSNGGNLIKDSPMKDTYL
jgi:hypothetical protein